MSDIVAMILIAGIALAFISVCVTTTVYMVTTIQRIKELKREELKYWGWEKGRKG